MSGNFATKKGSEKRTVVFICFIASLAGLLFGLDAGYVNGALELIQKDFMLSTKQAETVTGILMFGAALGAIISGFLSHSLGRKNTLVIAALIFTLFSILGMTAPTYTILLIARFALGLAVGIASFIAPLYVSELSPPNFRGALIAMYQLMITIGILAMFISNYLLRPENINNPASFGQWRYMMMTITVPAILMLIGCIFLPKSPRWLVLKGRLSEAEGTLVHIHNKDKIKEEIKEIQVSAQQTRGNISGLWKTNWLWKVVLLGIVLQLIQQFSGINAFMYYSTQIFQAAGFYNATLSTIIIGIVNVLTTLVAIALVDKIGRKPILYIGLILLIVSLSSIGFLFNQQGAGAELSVVQKDLLFISSLLFIFSFAVSLGPIIWIVCAEICPLQYRDIGITFSTATNWIANMIIGRYTLSMFENWGHENTFFVFAGCCLLGIIFIKFFMPETKNISLEHIEKNLKAGKPLCNIGEHNSVTKTNNPDDSGEVIVSHSLT